jgi:hypothetical protein
VVEDGSGELLVALESEGERCGGGWGWCSPFIGTGGAPGSGGNGRLNGFNAIDVSYTHNPLGLYIIKF